LTPSNTAIAYLQKDQILVLIPTRAFWDIGHVFPQGHHQRDYAINFILGFALVDLEVAGRVDQTVFTFFISKT
jgi:hypothetical protein